MGALVAYLKILPVLPQHSLLPLGRILAAFDKVPVIAAEEINHMPKCGYC